MFDIPAWPRALGEPLVSSVFKSQPEDFIVEEIMDIEFSDDGEFDWLFIEKVDQNTADLMAALARHAQLSPKAVSCSGLKDKRSVSRQWFSVQLPGKQVDWSGFPGIIHQRRHRKKLRRGTHKANGFELVLRNITGDLDHLDARLETIKHGVPNYFGEQRFGYEGRNIQRAQAWFEGGRSPSRQQRSMQLSAVRSYLFNQVLAERVLAGTWNRAVEGDVFMLAGSHSVFQEAVTAEIERRVQEYDICPTGPLPGKAKGVLPVGEAAELEDEVLGRQAIWLSGLERANVLAERRALSMVPKKLAGQRQEDVLKLQLELPAGCFCTALVRELSHYSTVSSRP